MGDLFCLSEKSGICDLTNCKCFGSADICGLHPEYGVGSPNSSCCHFFDSVEKLERSKNSSGSDMAFVMNSGEAIPVSVDGDGNAVVYTPESDKEYKAYLDSLDDWAEPKINDWEYVDTAAVHGSFTLVGHGERTNNNCGRFLSFKGCLRTDLHDISTLDGVSYGKGKVYVHKVHAHCDKPSCPICYKMGWARRESEKIKQRIAEASKTRGLAEHIIVSVPESDYGLGYEQLRAKALKAIYARGVLGGVMIFHGFRYRKFDVIRGGIRNMRGWYWAPHFHVIGFLLKSYAQCRKCTKAAREYVTGGGKAVRVQGNEKVCAGCDGFEALTRKLYGGWTDVKGKKHEGDKIIVRVMGERRTIKGTAWYQLNHASYKIGSTRFHVAVWFGNCSYRKLKVTQQFVKEICPICKHELVKIKYVGVKLLSMRGLFGEHDLLCDLEEPLDGHSECTGLAWIAKSGG
jgi:hypothetical protein